MIITKVPFKDSWMYSSFSGEWSSDSVDVDFLKIKFFKIKVEEVELMGDFNLESSIFVW